MAEALHNAAILFQRGACEEAEALCRALLDVTPNEPAARVLLGRILEAKGQGDAAQAEYRHAVKFAPNHVEGWLHWAKYLKTRGHLTQAEACLRLALEHASDTFAIHNDLGVLLLDRGNFDEAASHLERAVMLSPQSEIALCNMGIVRKGQGRIDEAISAYRRVIAINPALPEVHNNLGDALRDRDRQAAAASFEQALKLRPHFPEALDNLGVTYFFDGRLSEALEKFEQALAIQPNFRRALGHKTNTLFMLGRLAEAWRAYRHRFEVEGYKHAPHGRFSMLTWNGEEFSGKKILVWTELGLGEEVLQASMLPDVINTAARVTVECSPRLVALFTRSFPDVTLIARTNPSRMSDAAVDADFQIAGGDLGAVFRSDFADFPRHSGYLIPDRTRVASLKQTYGQGRLVVGLSWASGKSNMNSVKTLPLSAFGPILQQSGITFVNLQYNSNQSEVADVSAALGINIITDNTIDLAGDMDPVAAQIAAMDLVISVSNTSVHIAGALNVPVWNIVPGYNASSMWHWFHELDESPWYPSMKIYRRMEEDVHPLMERIAVDLQGFRGSHGEGR